MVLHSEAGQILTAVSEYIRHFAPRYRSSYGKLGGERGPFWTYAMHRDVWQDDVHMR